VRPYLEKTLKKKKNKIKNLLQNGAGRVARGVGPKFKPQHLRKKKNYARGWSF
jgi:hypothetical protein